MLLAIVLTFACSLGAQAQLQGGIEHSEQVEPADKRLQVGADFEDDYFKNVHANNLWVPIPDWLAGVWHTRTETQLAIRDLRFAFLSNHIPITFARSDEWVFGMQSDKTGQIWHFINVPAYKKVLTGKTYEFRHELSKQFPYTDDDKVVAKYRFTAFTVDIRSRKIKRVHQQESVMTFTPDGMDVVRMDGSVKMFEVQGTPRAISKNVVPLFKTKQYAPIPVYADIDMRQSFCQYLLSHNLKDRIPDAPAPADPGKQPGAQPDAQPTVEPNTEPVTQPGVEPQKD